MAEWDWGMCEARAGQPSSKPSDTSTEDSPPLPGGGVYDERVLPPVANTRVFELETFFLHPSETSTTSLGILKGC